MLRAQGRLPPPPAPRECRHRSPRAHGDIDIATDAGLTSRLPLAGLMPDQIALDKFTAAIVALLFSATAGLAQERLTKTVTLGVYHNRCERLAPRLLADVQRMDRMLDKADVMAGVVNEHEKVDQAGEAKWCEAFRPVIEKYKDGLFEPTR
jgi:hypothetical protein